MLFLPLIILLVFKYYLKYSHILRRDNIMKSKVGMALMGIGIGVGSAALYQNVKNGNMKKWVRKMNSAKTKAIDDLENMM